VDIADALGYVGTAPIESIAESVAMSNAGEVVLAAAAAWISDSDVVVRCLAWEVYRFVVLNRADLLPNLLDAAPTGLGDSDPDVRRRTVSALGNQWNPATIEITLPMLVDPDAEVRVQAVGALTGALQESPSDAPAIDALIACLDDLEPTVRDWTAFTLGVQLDVDRPDLRDKLVELLGEDEARSDAAAEAAMGLARRQDARAIPAILRHIADPEASPVWREAAEELGIALPD